MSQKKPGQKVLRCLRELARQFVPAVHGQMGQKVLLVLREQARQRAQSPFGILHKRSMVAAQGYIFRTPCAETAQGPYRRAKMLKTRRACTGASVEASAAFLALSGQVD